MLSRVWSASRSSARRNAALACGLLGVSAIIAYQPLRAKYASAVNPTTATDGDAPSLDIPISAAVTRPPALDGAALTFLRALNPLLSFTSQEQLVSAVQRQMADPAHVHSNAAVMGNINQFTYRLELSRGATVAEAVKLATVPYPFKMSSVVPMNTLIAYTLLFNPSVGPLLRASSPAVRHMVWEASNRGYNIGMDFCNRGDSTSAISGTKERSGISDGADSAVEEQQSGHIRLIPDLAVPVLMAGPTIMTGYWLTTRMPLWCTLRGAPGLVGIVHRFASTSLPAILALAMGHAVDLTTTRWRSVVYGTQLFQQVDGHNIPIMRRDSDGNQQPLLSCEAGLQGWLKCFFQKAQTATLVLMGGAAFDAICAGTKLAGTTQAKVLKLG